MYSSVDPCVFGVCMVLCHVLCGSVLVFLKHRNGTVSIFILTLLTGPKLSVTDEGVFD